MSNSQVAYGAAIGLAALAGGAFLGTKDVPNTINCGIEVGTRFAKASKDPSQIYGVNFDSGVCTIRDKSGLTIDSFQLTQR